MVDDQADIYTADVLRDIKSVHETAAGRAEHPTDSIFAKLLINDLQRSVNIASNNGNIAINSPGTIQAHTVNLKASRQRIRVNPPPGTIGADLRQSGYIQYLIKRYNEFASKDNTRATKFSHGAISNNIEHQFGAAWRLLASERFAALCEYLQGRISRTIIGKRNIANGFRTFSTYEEFLAKSPK